MTATTLPRISSADRLEQVNRELREIRAAIKSGGHGWGEQLQDEQRKLRLERLDLLMALGRHAEHRALLSELTLEA